jgi:hypothetical protein
MNPFRHFGRIPKMGDRSIARPLPTEDSTVHRITDMRGCIQKFPYCIDNETNNNNNNNNNKNKHSLRRRVMAAKLTKLTHKIAI